MLERIVDGVMEATVVPSFTRLGFGVRSRLFDWQPISDDLTGRTILVTGGTSGIGLAAVRQLAGMGARLLTVGRDRERGEQAAGEIRQHSGNAAVEFVQLDMGDLAAVRDFGAQLADREQRLDALAHNAGALLPERRETAEGVEMTLAVHLLGPYLLTRGLRPLLRQSVASRVVFMSSGGMYALGLDLDRLEAPEAGYSGAAAYARVKRAQVVLAQVLADEYASDGIVVHAMHPGWADTAGVALGIPGFGKVMRPLLRTPRQGADTLVWLLTAAEPMRSTGAFWHDRAKRDPVKFPWARPDEDAASRLVAWIEARIDRALAAS